MKTITLTCTPTGKDRSSTLMTLLILLSLLIISLRSAAMARPVYDSLSCLEIEGKVLLSDEPQNRECTIELISQYGQVDTIQMKDYHRKFRFVLSVNTTYAIRISKKGYLTKLISVNTDMPGDLERLHRFTFETPLLKEEALVHLNREAVDLPIAIIRYDEQNDCFSYDKDYTETVKKVLRRSNSFEKKSSLINTPSKELAAAYTN